MTVTELVQLYAPLLGLLVLAFWVGSLSQRVVTLERDVGELKRDGEGEVTIRDRLTALETKFDIASGDIKSIKRGMDGVQRQLGNLMTTKSHSVELSNEG